jgi:hypothetical protein
MYAQMSNVSERKVTTGEQTKNEAKWRGGGQRESDSIPPERGATPTKYARDGTSLAVGESSTEANNNKKLCCYVFHFLNQLFYFVTLGGLRWKFFIDTDIDDLPHLVILVCHISNPTLRGCRPVHTPESSY